MFHLIEKLDVMRMSDIPSILSHIDELQTPLGTEEQRDFLLNMLKMMAEKKSNVGLSLQYTLKRLLNEACKGRSFQTNQQISQSVTILLQHLAGSHLESTLKSIYLTKLKLDHLQFMLEMIPMVMHNYSHFPCNFTVFCYLYQEDMDLLFQVFAVMLSNYWCEVDKQGENLTSFIEMLRNELIKKIVVVLQGISSFEIT